MCVHHLQFPWSTAERNHFKTEELEKSELKVIESVTNISNETNYFGSLLPLHNRLLLSCTKERHTSTHNMLQTVNKKGSWCTCAITKGLSSKWFPVRDRIYEILQLRWIMDFKHISKSTDYKMASINFWQWFWEHNWKNKNNESNLKSSGTRHSESVCKRPCLPAFARIQIHYSHLCGTNKSQRHRIKMRLWWFLPNQSVVVV